MCGIAGFVSRKFTEQQLRQMTDCLRRRGPDADGFLYDPSVGLGLGHRRLSIIDLSEAANQPMWSHNQRYGIIFNGEIYNYREVAKKYNITQQTSSDTEVILEAFDKVGVQCINDFNGMFAMAIWDTQDKKLYLFRDRFGVKPLVYYWNGKDLAFASQIKALLQLPIERKINKRALQDYLFLEYIPGPATIFENIYKLPNGSYMVVQDGSMEIKKYYDFYEKVQARPVAAKNDQQVKEEFTDLLASSVKYRQISDVPIGAFLSGGTDSSLICALFQQQNEQPVNTFTIGFDVADFDESKEAAAVASVLKTNHAEFRLTDKDSLGIVEELADYYDEPFAAPSTIPSYLVCHEAKKLVTVAMSGDGGDELFMGYGYYDLYKKIKKIYRLDAGIGRKLLATTFNTLSPKYQRGARLLKTPSSDMLIHLWSEEQYMFSEKEVSLLLKTEYNNSSVRDTWRKIDAMNLHDFEKISLFDIQQYLAHNLLYKMDSASMANSLEVRNPYLDYRLVEYSFNLPLEFKVRNGTQKYLMKEVLRDFIPDNLVFRRKWGFPAPVGNWLDKELAYLLDKWLDPSLLDRQGIFDKAEVKKYRDAFNAGKKFHYKRLWAIIVFQIWYHKYAVNNAA
jgi:asparagine synthase (glutamine-hydrolysing)